MTFRLRKETLQRNIVSLGCSSDTCWNSLWAEGYADFLWILWICFCLGNVLFFGPNILANVYLVGCFGISSGLFFEGMIPFMEGKGAGFQIIHQTLADSSRFFPQFHIAAFVAWPWILFQISWATKRRDFAVHERFSLPFYEQDASHRCDD